MADLSAIKLPNGTTYNLKDRGALPLTGGAVTGPVSFGDSVSIDDATIGSLVVNGNASFANNIQANTINGVTVGSNPKFTDTNTVTTATTTGSGNAVTAVTASNGALTITKGTTFLTSHQDISGKADKSATVSTVAYDSTNKKITKTINGTTTDVVTVATLKTALGSMPASDVYSWAKASSKPTYTASEVGALASNTTYVSTITTTAGTHSAISSKSGAVSFNVPTKTSHLTNDSGFLTSHQTLYEANLQWGGKNFSASYGPIDAAMIGELGANRFAFLKADGITVEYSTNGGSTWSDYGLSNNDKVKLFAQGGSAYLGKHTSKGTNTVNDQLRITINTGTAQLYTALNKIAIYISTNGNGPQVKIEKALESTPTTFVTHLDWTGIAGWSGWNILNIDSITTYGNTAASQYGRIRFVFRQNSVNTNYYSTAIYRIMGFGGQGWTVPSNMAKFGHIYSYDENQNTTFPAQVTATQFNGNATSASSVPWSGVSSKPTTTGSKATGISIGNHTTGTVIGVQSSTTTASKATAGTAISIPNVTSAGSASNWVFENITVPKAASATACDDITSWSAGSGSASLTMAIDSSDSKKLNITFSHTHTAPTLQYTARSIAGVSGSVTASHVKSGGNGTAPTLGTAISITPYTFSDVTVPIKNTSASTFVTGTTHTITDNGHTHSI